MAPELRYRSAPPFIHGNPSITSCVWALVSLLERVRVLFQWEPLWKLNRKRKLKLFVGLISHFRIAVGEMEGTSREKNISGGA
jgi:hypothetical protein